MKEELLSKIISIVLVLSFIFSFWEVSANTEKIDSENDITLFSDTNITNENDTYYNSNNNVEYGSTTKEEKNSQDRVGIQDNENEINKAILNETETEATTEEWTDFSKAKFELVKEGISNAIVEISNVTPKEKSSYYLFINNNNQKPNITGDINNYNNKIKLEYKEDTNKFITVENEVRRNVELNQELYATVVESNSEGDLNIISYGNKLDRFEEPKYSDAFYATYVADDSDQIVINFTHAEENNRKIQIKIGKITDNSILQKIKNKDVSGFSSLLDYAKSNNAIYNETTDAVKDDWYAIEYQTDQTVGSTKGKLINLTGLQNDGYYYLYIKTDDENGKYISNEAVTLAQANVIGSEWAMHFYGAEDFKWADFGNIIDDTVANGKIPQTGANTLGVALCGALIISIGAFSYISYKKNKF